MKINWGHETNAKNVNARCEMNGAVGCRAVTRAGQTDRQKNRHTDRQTAWGTTIPSGPDGAEGKKLYYEKLEY